MKYIKGQLKRNVKELIAKNGQKSSSGISQHKDQSGIPALEMDGRVVGSDHAYSKAELLYFGSVFTHAVSQLPCKLQTLHRTLLKYLYQGSI